MLEAKNIQAKIGEGIYLARDVSKILHLPYRKVNRWMNEYWGSYTFGSDGVKSVNFNSLIEFYIFYKFRENGIGSTKIWDLHKEMSGIFKTSYPFAIDTEYFIEKNPNKKRIYIKHLEDIFKFDKKRQFELDVIVPFLKKIEFKDQVAVKFYPLSESKNVVVDPQNQFGQPTINGTNIKTETLANLFSGGETLENISELYNLPLKQVEDAILFQNAA